MLPECSELEYSTESSLSMKAGSSYWITQSFFLSLDCDQQSQDPTMHMRQNYNTSHRLKRAKYIMIQAKHTKLSELLIIFLTSYC